ncbi:hypothetical protein CPB83DRAFT_765832 [Crepidotus variabilis]|uniref:Uncharacterized protein n=1 Tax=Crepidotus variabilis TaxID=179855 RepID=A0A9P6EGZ8_9AGAR|nr:hypothetical protein CPB83DRAFT_765832 [Crepidotus variabilis]
MTEDHREEKKIGTFNVNLADPECAGMTELPSASKERAQVAKILRQMAEVNLKDISITRSDIDELYEPPEANSLSPSNPLFTHLSNGLAYTIGSALGCLPPSTNGCLEAYQIPNNAGLTSGSRAWSKHSHRSFASPKGETDSTTEDGVDQQKKTSRDKVDSEGWWGRPSGPVSIINDKSLTIFWRVMNNATWRNLHWLPHEVLVYEVRVKEGYGMRWAQDRSGDVLNRPWIFRGFLEPQMAGGHEVGWRHLVVLPS